MTEADRSAPRTLGELLQRAATLHGQRTAVIEDGRSLAYGELHRRARGVASLLAAAGPRNDLRIALLADNGIRYAALYWGVLLAGGTTVELNPGVGDAELHHELETAEPLLLLAEREHAARVSALTGTDPAATGAVVVGTPRCDGVPAGDGSDLARRLERALSGRPPEPGSLPVLSPDEPASIVFTSGTTGRVKGAHLTHGNLASVTEAVVTSFGLEEPGAPGRRAGGTGECFAGNLPLYYTYGKSVLLAATRVGAPIVFTRRLLSARVLLGLLRDAAITHLSLVPYYANMLLELPEFRTERLPLLRRLTVAGGALPPAGLRRLVDRFPSRVQPMYGLTEASTRVTCMPAAELAARPRSCGSAIDGVEIRILDPSGAPLPPHETGEVVVRGPNVMREYFRDPEATARAFVDGWLRTGDLGFLDDDGYLFIAGRTKDVIKVMGESVAAFSVESAIAELPGVAEVAVTAAPDERTGEAICAFVVPAAGQEPTAEAIRRHCSERLGRSRVPAHVRMVNALPRTGSGKVRKHLLDPAGGGEPGEGAT